MTPVRDSPAIPRLRSVNSYTNIRTATTTRNLNKSLQNLNLNEEGASAVRAETQLFCRNIDVLPTNGRRPGAPSVTRGLFIVRLRGSNSNVDGVITQSRVNDWSQS